MATFLGRFAWVLAAVLLAGCDGNGADPAVPSGQASSALAPKQALSAPPSADVPGSAVASAPSASVSVSRSTPPLDLSRAPQLVGDDGAPLPQTEDRPTTDSAAFKKRIELLWRAIVADDPSIANDVFFPDVAYALVKDIEKPKADWTHRLMKNFARDIHAYHKDIGGAAGATFVGVDLDDKRVKWMDKGKEGNKLGYFRVTRSHLLYKDASGVEKKLELTSLISWRGEWFIVHLHGFK